MTATAKDLARARAIALEISRQEMANLNEWTDWIAQALAQERERAAQIVEQFGRTVDVLAVLAPQIAAAVRAGNAA